MARMGDRDGAEAEAVGMCGPHLHPEARATMMISKNMEDRNTAGAVGVGGRGRALHREARVTMMISMNGGKRWFAFGNVLIMI